MKLKFFVFVLIISVTAKSQNQFGLFAGPQITDVRYMVNGQKQESSLKYGVNIGAQIKFPFENKLSFSPAIMYNLRGYDVRLGSPAVLPDLSAKDNNTSFHTVEISFLLQHDFTIEPGHFFIKIGPSLDFALFGKEKYNTSSSTINRNMKFGFNEYGHYLASAIAQFGFENKNGIFFYAHYNYSLTTMSNADDGPTIGNRAAGISIGKYLKNKRIVLDTKNRQ